MELVYSDGPIVAVSTSTSTNAAIAIIRISGFVSVDQFRQFFTLASGPIEPRHVYFTKLVSQGEVWDEICLTFFRAPHSYNGENVLELSVHGNLLNVERILNLFVERGGCRLAYPGEFTYRALKNRKLTLSQVEGLDLFLNANSGYALNHGLSLLNGGLHSLYLELHALFIKHKSSLELAIDFAEDVGEQAAREHFFGSLRELQTVFARLSKQVSTQDLSLISPEIVLAGLPNSGKSSLFNKLLADDRAIVSATAGTTRDFISESIAFEGVRYRLIDTAGLRQTSDEIEQEGIKRTRIKVAKSFFSILLINPFVLDHDFEQLMELPFDLMLFTHADLPGFDDHCRQLIARWPQLGSIGAIDLLGDISAFELKLKQAINKKYLETVSKHPLLLDRHKSLILEASSRLNHYVKLAGYEQDVAILSSELNTLGHCISELIGIISPDQILNSIFSNFCIGK
jgi:tRNA modification GTPase